jgi:MFS family permease
MSTQSSQINVQPASAHSGRERHAEPASNSLTWWAAASLASVVGFSRISYGLLLPSIRADLHGTYSSYGLVSTANFVGYLLGTLALPPLLARYRNQLHLVSASLLLMNAAIIVSAASFDLVQLSIWRFLTGFFSAIALVLTLSLTLDCIRPEERGRASGTIWMGASSGIVISGIMAPPLLSVSPTLAWRFAWVAMGVIGGVAVFGLYRKLRHLNVHLLASAERAIRTQESKSEHNTISSLLELLRPRGFLFAGRPHLGSDGHGRYDKWIDLGTRD